MALLRDYSPKPHDKSRIATKYDLWPKTLFTPNAFAATAIYCLCLLILPLAPARHENDDSHLPVGKISCSFLIYTSRHIAT